MVKKLILFVLAAVLLYSLYRLLNGPGGVRQNQNEWIYHTYRSENGWGYRIFTPDSVLLIQQDVVPGIPGNQGFDTEAKADLTARFVIGKLNQRIFPPAVTVEELDSLKVLPAPEN